uniref:Secretion regulating guanine nucleotide exchange factor n=1 Tax=Scleropages formosus TaxID=113540 RepID=A0A8C9TYS2_SCLFO
HLMDSVKSFSALSSSALFTWGANSHGQLGHAYAEDVYEPRVARCELPAGGLRALCGGGGHSALITEAGQLLVCGQNHRGQLGLGHTSEVTTFRLCFSLGQRSVRQVSCGWDFTLILTDGGQVLACGSNTYGQLGLPQVPGHTAEPLPLQALKEHVLCVAAGLRHALAVTCELVVPQGSDSGWCGVITFFLFVFFFFFHPPAGGDVFLWGSNKQGQLGTTRSFVAWPALLDRTLMGGESVTDVWSGWAHLVAKTESGRVFSWGRSDYGQLGRAVSASQSLRVPSGDSVTVDSGLVACIPVQVEALAGAAQIACGSEHNLAIVGDRLLSWGWNEHGMCGDGSCADVPHPTPIAVLQDARPVLIGCGAGHSMALCTTTVFGPTRTAEGASGGRGDMVGTTPLPSRLTPPTSGTSCSTAQDTG